MVSDRSARWRPVASRRPRARPRRTPPTGPPTAAPARSARQATTASGQGSSPDADTRPSSADRRLGSGRCSRRIPLLCSPTASTRSRGPGCNARSPAHVARRLPGRASPSHPEDTTRSSHSKEMRAGTVLVADDDAMHRATVEALLAGGFVVSTASSGEEARTRLLAQPITSWSRSRHAGRVRRGAPGPHPRAPPAHGRHLADGPRRRRGRRAGGENDGAPILGEPRAGGRPLGRAQRGWRSPG